MINAVVRISKFPTMNVKENLEIFLTQAMGVKIKNIKIAISQFVI